ERVELLLQFEPRAFGARELPCELALPRDRLDESLARGAFVRLGAREPRVELALFRGQRIDLAFDRRLLGDQRLARVVAALPRLGLLTLLLAAVAARIAPAAFGR